MVKKEKGRGLVCGRGGDGPVSVWLRGRGAWIAVPSQLIWSKAGAAPCDDQIDCDGR